MTITNPILRGFNPDPSIVRVDHDYYIATSTFEWFPGVQIHHSRNLIDWSLVGRPLDRVSQLNMRGNEDSGGVWAPCLTYSDGLFWLIFTDVKVRSGAFKDTHNYLVTSPAIGGPWSEPIHLNSSGFDPSLFHDDDGRKWLVNMDWDWRPSRNRFSGILLQEFDVKARCLVGPITRIFAGTDLGLTEGPHLYRRDGYYYLLTAEGGTGHGHAVTMARARALTGPYEPDPAGPLMTAVGHPDTLLKKAGHADIVETPDGWYMVHLCSRPIGHGVRDNPEGWSILGRETAIQRVAWSDGWLHLEDGGNGPAVSVRAPDLQTWTAPDNKLNEFIEEFSGSNISIHWQSLRSPLGEDQMSLTARSGYLRLYGAESPRSRFRQSLIARRQQAFKYRAETTLDFSPHDCKQMAGIICYYGTDKYHYLYVTSPTAGGSRFEGADGGKGTPGRELAILSAVSGEDTFPVAGSEIVLPPEGALALRAEVDGPELQFSWSVPGGDWQEAGPVLDMTFLSDEQEPGGRFTGAFIGICCQDLSGLGRPADFARFSYREGSGQR